MKKLAFALLTLGLFVPTCLGNNTNGFSVAKADNENTISVDCDNSLVENGSYWAYVNLRAYEQLSALSLEVHFDSDVLTVREKYNSISDSLKHSLLLISWQIKLDREMINYIQYQINQKIAAVNKYYSKVKNK